MAIVQSIPAVNGNGRSLKLLNPATQEPVGEVRVRTADEVHAVIERARRAQPAWEALGFDGRGRCVERVLQLVLDRQEEIVEVLRRETGRSRAETLMIELFPACDTLAYFARNAKKLLRDESPSLHLLKNKRAVISYRPLGVIGIITPWNAPFILSLNPTVQALMAGNAVVLKPSEVTPFSGALIGDLFREAGLPEDVLTVLQGDGETGAALVNGGVNKISFTGSERTGRKIGEACGRNLVPCTLELGGKDPMIICADADIDMAAKGCVFSSMVNAGQVCCSTERAYVVESVAEAFTRKVVDYVKTLKQGTEGEYDIGPIIWPEQLEVIERHVADARAKGAQVVTGGQRNRAVGELFYEPTVLTHVTHDMLVMREETFGPILPIVVVKDEAEAVRMANDSSFGLSSSLWTRDHDKALRLARQIQSGSVCVNDSSVTYACLELPFGGMKASGVGQVHGASGLKSYCFAKPIVLNRFTFKQDGAWYPYTTEKASGIQKAMRWLFGTSIGRFFT